MGDCCRGSSKKTSKGSRWLNWIGAGGFALVVVLLALFDGYPLVSQAAPLVLLALGGNFAAAAPDTEFTARALRNCALTVQISTKLNRSHLVTGATALILPRLRTRAS